MTTPTGGMHEAALGTSVAAPAGTRATRPFYWSVRRELWENRSIYVAPLAVAAVIFLGYAMSAFHLPRRMRAVLALDPEKQLPALAMPFSMAATLIIMTGYVVGVFYCLDALYGERRDRSLLFWKSLPVSDLTTVLAKAGIPLMVLPVIVCAVAIATQAAMRLLATAVLLASGTGAAPLWTRLPPFEMTVGLLYGVTVHVLWHAPLWAWLLLVSVWARRSPLLWAVLPPLALGAVERIAFQTSYFGALIGYRVIGAMQEAFTFRPEDKHLVLRLSQLDPLGFLGTPGLWLGLLAAAGFLAAAARVRRRREPI